MHLLCRLRRKQTCQCLPKLRWWFRPSADPTVEGMAHRCLPDTSAPVGQAGASEEKHRGSRSNVDEAEGYCAGGSLGCANCSRSCLIFRCESCDLPRRERYGRRSRAQKESSSSEPRALDILTPIDAFRSDGNTCNEENRRTSLSGVQAISYCRIELYCFNCQRYSYGVCAVFPSVNNIVAFALILILVILTMETAIELPFHFRPFTCSHV